MEFMISYKVDEASLPALREARDAFFAAESARGDGDCGYRSLALPDGVSFVHLATFADDDAKTRFQGTEHFATWGKVLGELAVEGPAAVPLEEVAAV